MNVRRASAASITASVLIVLCLGLSQSCFDMGAAFYPADEAADRMKAGAKYHNEKKWPEAEREYTRAIIAWNRAIDRHLNRKGAVYETVDESLENAKYYRYLKHELAIAFYNRGLALKNHGDYYCARTDFIYAQTGVYGKEKENAHKMVLQMLDLIKRTGRKGRADCPPKE